MDPRISVIVLSLMFAIACWKMGFADEQASSQDGRCQSIGMPVNAYSTGVIRKWMREAIARADWPGIKFLIWDGADPDWTRNTKWHKDAVQETLNRDLLHASAIGDKKLILKLLQEGADVNAKAEVDDFMSPLIWAARCNQANAVALLLEKGADANISGDYAVGATGLAQGSTALIWAAWYGNIDVIKLLLAHGANPNAQLRVNYDISNPADEQNGNGPLLLAGNDETAELLLRAKADPNQIGIDGISPLMKAASNGDLERCKLLLAWGADPRLKDRSGQTATDYAEKAGYPQIAELLTRPRQD